MNTKVWEGEGCVQGQVSESVGCRWRVGMCDQSVRARQVAVTCAHDAVSVLDVLVHMLHHGRRAQLTAILSAVFEDVIVDVLHTRE